MSFLKKLLNLHQGEEKKERVIEDILSNISFRGANLWILACAICIGYLRFRPIEENRQEFAHRYGSESDSIVYLLLYQSVQGCTVRAFSAYFAYHLRCAYRLCGWVGRCYLPHPSRQRKSYPRGSDCYCFDASTLYSRLWFGNG